MTLEGREGTALLAIEVIDDQQEVLKSVTSEIAAREIRLQRS